MNRVALWLLTLTLTLVSACGQKKLQPAVVIAQPGQVKQTVQIVGRVFSSSRKLIPAPFDGRVSKLNVRLGELVVYDQQLVALDSTDLAEKIQSQRLTIAKNQSQINANRMQIQKLKRDFTRSRQAFNLRTIAQSQLDEIELHLRVLKSQTQSLVDAIVLEERKLKELIAVIDEGNLRSPISGTVIDLWINPADFVAGIPVKAGDPLVTIASKGNMKIKSLAPEFLTANLNEGQTVLIKLVSNPQKHWFGRISSIRSPSGKAEEAAGNFEVMAEFDPKADMLRNGLEATIETTTGFLDKVLTLPKTAVTRANNQSFVMKKTPEGFTKHPVALGLIGDDAVEVTGGLNNGDPVLQVYEELN
jgi:RND family efflux transporter MFP subunit